MDDDRHEWASEDSRARLGKFGTIPRDPGASLLFRTVNFFALNNGFVPSDSMTIGLRRKQSRRLRFLLGAEPVCRSG